MDKTFYENYKTIKRKLDYSYKGYNLQALVPGYLNFIFDGITPSSREILKEFYRSFKSVDLRKIPISQSKTIISYLINRQDYKNLAYATQELYPKSEVVDLSALPNVKFSIFSLFYIWHLIKSTRLVFARSIGNSIHEKLSIIAILTLIFNQIRLLEKTKLSNTIESYVCFNSSYKEESLLCLYFNKRKVETITLQHGIFCNYKLLMPFDYINFENRQAQKVLAWGQATVDYFSANGVDASNLIILGNPKYRDVKITKVLQSFKSCLVLLGRGLYTDTNNKLLAMLTEFNKKHNNSITFYIKKHPFLLDEEHREYADISQNIIFLGKEHPAEEVLRSSLVDFSISVNTTAYYESLALGKPCLRWVEAENEDFFGLDDKFENISEFEKKLEALKSIDQNIIQRDMKNVIRYIFNTDLQNIKTNNYEN